MLINLFALIVVKLLNCRAMEFVLHETDSIELKM